MTHISGAPPLPEGYFYRINPNGRTFGGPRETVEICEHKSLLGFKWVKVHMSAGVYRDIVGTTLDTPHTRAAKRACENWMYGDSE